MYRVTWDAETGGVKLQTKKTDECLGVSPRPVFFEELDLLGLNNLPKGQSWKYPHTKAPLLWACNKQYFYRGRLVFEAKGANIFDLAKVQLQPDAVGLTLKPVDVHLMLERCKDEMFLMESEAIEFIRDTYQMYSSIKLTRAVAKSNQLDFEKLASMMEKQEKKKMAIVKQDCNSFDIVSLENAVKNGRKIYKTTEKIDVFLASFSGGKDSQVILDLCTRALPPSSFQVIYSDTGYELPSSLKLYEEVKKYYNNLYPELRFRTAKNHASVLDYWDKIGTPSDTHRWCCSVMKTAPLYRMLKLENSDKQARVLTFDGIRAEESTTRSTYSRIGKGVKHDTVINASPILSWTTTETFLYLLKYKLPINPAYRQGMTRVGCLICPFSSEWNDMISNHKYTKNLTPFLSRIIEKVKQQGVKDIDVYIKDGNWKRRGGGRGMNFPSFMEVIGNTPDLILKIRNPQQPVFTWLRAVAPYQLQKRNGQEIGELRFKSIVYKFSLTQDGDYLIIKLKNSFREPILQGLFKRAISKSVHCIMCEACEVECPRGALTILPTPKINESKCIGCHKCLTFHEKGCIVAHSVSETGTNSDKMKLTSYNNFGLREEWLDLYMSNPSEFFNDDSNGLNKKEQEPSFAKWLAQASIIDSPISTSRNITDLGKILSQIYINDPSLVWEIVWINLSYNAPIAKWYKENIAWGREFTQPDIVELVKNDYPDNSITTIKNVVYALFDTFRKNPIGKSGQLKEISRLNYQKLPYNALSREAIAYSLFKYAENIGSRSFRVSDFYSPNAQLGVYREFGISRSEFESKLRSLNSDKDRLMIAELQMGLDHISLRDDINAESALKTLFSL